MTVKEIIKKYLEDNGYGGLVGDECSCDLDNFMPCDGEFCDICEAGYKHKWPDGCEVDFVVTISKEPPNFIEGEPESEG